MCLHTVPTLFAIAPRSATRHSLGMANDEQFFECPHCGEDVPTGAKACPHCGSDDNTGWKKDADFEHLDLPEGYGNDSDEKFDAAEYERKAFGWGPRPLSKPPIPMQQLIIPLIALLLIALFLWRYV
ncbi:MAG: zinc ribbon domain-containing protein [Verrucomicrobiota bacterium]|nr:zinc ribbon domain-containing protein [Verrucomicrobiota bacterium]